MNRRILMIVAAVVLAIVGTGAVYAYVSGANDRAVAGKQAVNVMIVNKRIPAGTSALEVRTGNYAHLDHLPADATPQGAVTTLTEDWQSQVATGDIQPGQVVLRAMFGARVPTTSGLVIPTGKMAVSIKITADGDVAGFVQPGSQIAIFDTFVLVNGQDVPSGSSTSSDKADNWATKLLLPRVDVLAVSQAAPSKTGTTNSQSNTSTTVLLITLAVAQPDAERLIHIAQTGRPYLALLSDTSKTAAAPGVDNHHRLGSVFPNGITP